MKKLLMSCTFLSGNFVYQYFLSEPDYLLAFDRSYWQAVGMLFIVIYPKTMPQKNNLEKASQ